jgi:hypothetical protein
MDDLSSCAHRSAFFISKLFRIFRIYFIFVCFVLDSVKRTKALSAAIPSNPSFAWRINPYTSAVSKMGHRAKHILGYRGQLSVKNQSAFKTNNSLQAISMHETRWQAIIFPKCRLAFNWLYYNIYIYDSILHNRRCENIKSYLFTLLKAYISLINFNRTNAFSHFTYKVLLLLF